MYRFKLEALLSHRRYQEEICQKELALTESHLTDEQGKLCCQKREMHENTSKLQAKKKESINVSDIILSINYIQHLSKRIADQKKSVRQAAKKVSQKRNNLIMNTKKRMTLEKLKEKERLVYQQTILQNERKLMDEVASTKYARKK